MSKLEPIRRLFRQLSDLWHDRQIHLPAIQKAIRSIPARFRDAETSQKRYLIALILFIIGMQILLIAI